MAERWRTGTSEGTDELTIYRHVDGGPPRGRLIGMMREPEDAALACTAVTHWWNAEHRWEYGVEGRWPDGGINLDWRGSREDAEGVLAARAETPGIVVQSRLVRRLITTGPVEEVPDGE